MPFLAFTIIQKAGSHLSKPRELSSKIVPTFTENCLAQSRHFQIRRVDRNAASSDLQTGHFALPSGQRTAATKFKALSESPKYLIASASVFGNSLSFFMPQIYLKTYSESSI